MSRARRRDLGPILLSVLALVAARPGRSAEELPEATGFAGIWAIAASNDDVVVRPGGAGRGSDAGDPVPSGQRGGGGTFDLPLEVMTDARRLVATDDGTTLRVTYPSGRKRSFVTDGEKRYLDDGDGPADVVARRKGSTVTVTSEWFRGYKLTETWEVRDGPRRLVVTGKLKGRESNSYRRTYEPGKPLPAATPTAAPAAAAGPAAAGAATTPAGANSAPPSVPRTLDRIAECTIRPPRHAGDDVLRGLVRVSQQAAERAAVASLSPLKSDDVISSDPEVFEDCLVWPFTLRISALKGVQEIFVDAGDGKVVRSEFVPTGPPPTPAAP